jgi:Ca2+-binding RTX toxin-like protein
MAVVTIGPAYPGETKDVSAFDIVDALSQPMVSQSATQFVTSPYQGDDVTWTGTGLTYDAAGHVTGGTLTGFSENDNGVFVSSVTGLSVPFPITDSQAFLQAAFSGSDTMTGNVDSDKLVGYAGNDSLDGAAGPDTLVGGDGDNSLDGGVGNDSILGGSGQDSVRGLDDNDSIDGGGGNDDLNGNKGDDTVHGGQGADFVRGGQGNDLVYGDDGEDVHVNGNIGNDTVHGGNGNDTVFGGQGDDQVFGDDGNDYLSGDLGNDTLTGGQGADSFRLGFNGGHDVVTDFNAAEGDRVLVDHGATYSVTQSGADTVITLSGGEQLTLQGVNSSTLPDGWIVVS